MVSRMAILSIPVKDAEHGYSKAWVATAEYALTAVKGVQTNGQSH